MTPPTAERVIASLHLRPLPVEGGFYRETYRSPHSTAIYFLLTRESFSAMHRLRSAEVYHFYLGDPVEMLVLEPGGGGRFLALGTDILHGAVPQVIIPGGVWQGSRVADGGAWALMGTTMAPGFDVGEFELGRRDDLCRHYPAFLAGIHRLTR